MKVWLAWAKTKVCVRSPSLRPTANPVWLNYSSRILVRDGETVSVETQIVGGFMNPHDILRLSA